MRALPTNSQEATTHMSTCQKITFTLQLLLFLAHLHHRQGARPCRSGRSRRQQMRPQWCVPSWACAHGEFVAVLLVPQTPSAAQPTGRLADHCEWKSRLSHQARCTLCPKFHSPSRHCLLRLVADRRAKIPPAEQGDCLASGPRRFWRSF